MEQWVTQLIEDRYKTQDALAKAIGMSDSALGRGVKRGTLSFKNLLRLALATGVSASVILRMADKGIEADLIEQLYGAPQETERPDVRAVASLLEQMSAPYVEGLRLQLMEILRERSGGNGSSTPPVNGGVVRDMPATRDVPAPKGKRRRARKT